MPEPVPAPSPRQAMLARLAGALTALGEKMRVQQQAAVDVCAMGIRAEEIARTARDLAFDRRFPQGAGLQALSEELDTFAAEMLASAERVQRDTLLGRAVAEALGRHAEDLSVLAAMPAEADDLGAIRARLRPMLVTLDTLPTRLKASRERTAEVAELAARSRALAGQAAALAAGTVPGRQDGMLALSRALGALADDAAEVSARLAADAALAAGAAEAMAGRVEDLSASRPGSDAGGGLARVIEAGQRMAGAADAAAPRPHSWSAAMRWDLGRRHR